MIDLTIHRQALDRNIQKARESGVVIPTFENMKHPETVPEPIRARLRGVGLWDVIESCDIKGSSDASIRNVVPAHIECITDAAPIEQVICNGGTAGRLYKRYLQERTGLPAIVLPSTSPANAAWRLERLVERWHEAVDWAAF